MLTAAAGTKVFWEGLAFDVPSSWTFQPANIDEHYIFIVGFIGTAPWTAECVPTTGPGSATGSMCHSDPALGPHTVTIAMQTHDGPGPLEPAGYLRYQTGQTSILDVDGIPALIDRGGSGAGGPGTVVQLTIQRPARQGVWLTLSASYEGPGEAELVQQIDAVFNSLRVDPPLQPLPTDDTGRALAVARAIDALDQDPAQACYPRQPDASRRATLTAATTPGASPAPRSVTCRTELATVPGGFWKLTLTVEWGAPGDPATTGTTWMYLDPGGGPGQIFSSGNPLY